MKRGSKIIIVIIALVLCCVASVIGATYGLLYETFSMQNHLVAGSLKATLVRQRLISNNIDDTGTMKSVIDNTVKDFTSGTQDNIFGISADMLIVPGSSFTAEMKISNNGDVAFHYYVEVTFNAIVSDSDFASMLKLSVESAEGERRECLIQDGLTLGKNDEGLGLVEVGDFAIFTVKLEFLDSPTNNKVENKFAMFDLLVHAEQQINAI